MATSLRFSPAAHLSPNSSSTPPPSPDTADNSVEDLTSDLEPINENPFAFGGYADVYKYRARASSILGSVENRIFVVKAVRPHLFGGNKDKAKNRIRREIHIWGGLDHQNVLKLHGLLSRDNNPLPCLVSDYMGYGTARDYVKNNLEANLICIICDIAKGLSYLHSKGIAHGDIKAMNILVDHDGRARIGDFGISRMLSDDGRPLEYTTTDGDRSDRWMAVEYHKYEPDAPSPHGPTKPGDVWSFGCTVLELFSGELPFHGVKEGEVTVRLNRGEAPEFPLFSAKPDFEKYRAGVTVFCYFCWTRDPVERPKMSVLEPVICAYCSVANCSGFERSNESTLENKFLQGDVHNNNRAAFDDPADPTQGDTEGGVRSRSSSQSTDITTPDSDDPPDIQIAVVSEYQEEIPLYRGLGSEWIEEIDTNCAVSKPLKPTTMVPLPVAPSLETILRKRYLSAQSVLNEVSMSVNGCSVQYTEESSGPPHLRTFTVTCHVNNKEYGRGTVSGKKKYAKERAATAALQRLYLEYPSRFANIPCLPELQEYLDMNNMDDRATLVCVCRESANAPGTMEYRAEFTFDSQTVAVGVGPTPSIAEEHAARQVLAVWSPPNP